MAETSVEKRLQTPREPDYIEIHENLAKRLKKEPGAVTGKSVVVFKSSDVTSNNKFVFMPNTIEMAQIKKADKGQFKTNVQISSKMTEKDIQKALEETFPILRHQRFYCAAAVDNRSRLDFHGERRIWDGHSIKRRIKGNSALYILMEETQQQQQQQQQDELDSKQSEPSTLKRSHDQMTTSEQSKQTSEITPDEIPPRSLSFHHVTYPGYERQSEHGSLPKHVGSYPVIVSGPTPTAVEKIADLLPTEKQLRLQEGDKFAAMQHVFLVPSQHIPPPVCSSSMSIHSVANTSGMVTMATSLPPSFPMGTFMVPAGGIVVAQPGPLANQAVSTVTDHQSLGKPVCQVAQGQEVRQTGLPIMPQVMVSSTLTPQMNRLNISNATSQQLQKPVIAENSVVRKDQNIQTDGTETDRARTTLAQLQSNTGLSVGYSSITVSASQDHFRQSHDEKTVSTQIMDKRAYESIAASMAATAATERHQYRPGATSDHESVSSDQTDSGIETTADNTRERISQTEESYLEVVKKTQRLMQNLAKLKEAEWSGTNIQGGENLSLLSGVAENRKQISMVDQICPNSSSVKGGIEFILIFNKHLPSDIKDGYAYFGNSEPVKLSKVNELNLAGIVPASQVPGRVMVKVISSTGSYLGETSFEYFDEVENVLRQLVDDRELQTIFFRLWAEGLGSERKESEKRQLMQPPPNFKTAETKINECKYDADDEASSSDSSDDGNESYSKVAGYYQTSKALPNHDVIDDVIGKTGEKAETANIYEQSPECVLDIFRQIGDGVQTSGQVNLCILYQFYSEELENPPSYTLYDQERRANIVQLDSSPSSLLPENLYSDTKRDENRLNKGTTDNSPRAQDMNNQNNAHERSSDTENTEVIDQDGLNFVDFDQNSEADKSRRAEERRNDKPGDWAPDSL